jgi:hypothetical protein
MRADTRVQPLRVSLDDWWHAATTDSHSDGRLVGGRWLRWAGNATHDSKNESAANLRDYVYTGPELPFLGDVPTALPPSAGHVNRGCSFAKCPRGPFIHVITTHMNLPFRYLRLLWSLDRAVEGLRRNRQLLRDCVCVMAGDFVGNRREPFVEYALRAWPGDSLVVDVALPFARGKALQACRDAVVTPPDETMLLLLDNDIVLFPGFFEKLLPRVSPGRSFVVAAPWSTVHSDRVLPGAFRPSNTGSIAFYLSDLKAGLPGRTGTYGGEDTALVKQLQTKARVEGHLVRWCELWHVAHPQLWKNKQLFRADAGQLAIDAKVWFPSLADAAVCTKHQEDSAVTAAAHSRRV